MQQPLSSSDRWQPWIFSRSAHRSNHIMMKGIRFIILFIFKWHYVWIWCVSYRLGFTLPIEQQSAWSWQPDTLKEERGQSSMTWLISIFGIRCLSIMQQPPSSSDGWLSQNVLSSAHNSNRVMMKGSYFWKTPCLNVVSPYKLRFTVATCTC